MSALFDRTVFSVEGIDFTWEDVVLAARNAGSWQVLERAAREGWACLRHLAAGEGGEPEQEINAEAADFRYRRDLVSGSEAETWLDQRELSIDEWMDHIRRRVLRRLWGSRLESLVRSYPAPADALEEVLRVDAICSDEAARLAGALAGRAAAAASAGESLETVRGPDRVAAVDRGFARFRAARLTPESVNREIAAHQMDWIRVDCRALGFGDLARAREAVLCIREDGLEFDQVAGEARTPVYEERFYLDELEEVHRSVFLAARPLDLLGPIEFEGKYTIFRLLDKVLPGAADPLVIQRAETRVLERAVAEETRRRVRWEVRW